MKPLAPNTLLQNRYLVVQLIGRGGMGEVYMAVDQRLGSAIALKRTLFSDDEQLGSAFEREARTLARLRHPVLPKVSDHFTEDGTQYLVMEHISGEDISKRLEQSKKPFPLSWVLFWADHLLDALTYLHSYDPPIIHRDIKPQNLKLTDENNIILLDFGLAKDNTGDTRLTTSGSIVGYTPHYAPMEQIRGTGTDARSDIYSLSATLYQILTDTVPSDALTRADAYISGFEDPVKPISQINPEVPEAVSAIILKGMNVSQDKRHDTARDMQKALRDAYSKAKSDVSTKTAAASRLPSDIKPSQVATKVLPTPSPDIPVQSNAAQENNPIRHSSVSELSSITRDEKSEQDFDATWRMDANEQNSVPDQSSSPTENKQSAIKTEVFIAGSSPEMAAAQNGDLDKKPEFARKDDFGGNKFSDPVEDFSDDEDFGADKDFSQTNDFSDVASFSPDSTTPLYISDDQDDERLSAESDFDAALPADSAAGFVSQTDISPSAGYATSTTTQEPFPTQKTGGKTYAIAAGLAAFFVIAIGAAGLIWYVFGSTPAVTKEASPPVPQATVEATPTPEARLEAVTNTNSAERTNSDADANSAAEPQLTETISTDKTVEQSGKTPRAERNPPPAKISTPKLAREAAASKQPTAKKTDVKKAPVKGSSSDILP